MSRMANHKTARREAFVGLIAPIGVNLDEVVEALNQAFKTINYTVNPLRLTTFLDGKSDLFDLEYDDEFQRYQKYIAAGDAACRDAGRNDFFSLYGIALLNDQYEDRRSNLPEDVVHIFRQIKRTEEIATLKEAYGPNIVFVACYASRPSRVSNLTSKILSSTRGLGASLLEARALEIIDIDENERDNPHGQRVVDCFQHADYVLDCSTHSSTEASAARFIEAFFGYPFITPSRDEYCSYVAKSASLRSADLSRQVGAAIFGEHCEVISLGCNEVPRAGGGTYWGDGPADARDFRLGSDSNQKVRQDMVRDLLVRLQEKEWLRADLSKTKPDDLVESALRREVEDIGPLSNAMINDVIEYGRMVHAEMNAITDAARFRRSTVNATLYCTTMPCHMCTKLVIASGIKRVVYTEPYYKSLVGELYQDSVCLGDGERDGMVVFEQLKGVTPAGFRTVFSKGKRKTASGSAQRWDRATASPIFTTPIPYYVEIEAQFIDDLRQAMRQVEETRRAV